MLVLLNDGDRPVGINEDAGRARDAHWTLDEAAGRLDPPMSTEQVRALVHSAGLRPVGRRRTGFGRFRMVYDPREVREAHAAVSPLLGIWEAGPGVRYDRTV